MTERDPADPGWTRAFRLAFLTGITHGHAFHPLQPEESLITRLRALVVFASAFSGVMLWAGIMIWRVAPSYSSQHPRSGTTLAAVGIAAVACVVGIWARFANLDWSSTNALRRSYRRAFTIAAGAALASAAAGLVLVFFEGAAATPIEGSLGAWVCLALIAPTRGHLERCRPPIGSPSLACR